MKRIMALLIALCTIFSISLGYTLTLKKGTYTFTRESIVPGKNVVVENDEPFSIEVISGDVDIVKTNTSKYSYTQPARDVVLEMLPLQEITVKFNSNGGGNIADQIVIYDEPYGTLPSPSKTGYSFNGWYTESNFVNQVTSSTVVTATDEHTLYAKWTGNTYYVKYNGNGNTGGSMSNSQHTYGTASNLTANAFTKTGYSFQGWSTTANGSKQYDNNASISTLATSGTKDLYAVWKGNTYYVKYNANGENVSGTMANSTHTYGTASNLTANTFTRTGYSFAGWSTTANGSKQYNNSASISTLATSGTKNLYAVWTANTYYVKYNANGGTGTMANSTHTYGTASNLTANVFTREGYIFEGWSTTTTGSVEYADKASIRTLIASGTKNLYAVWREFGIQDIPVGAYIEYSPSYTKNGTAVTSATVLGADAGTADNQTFNFSDYSDGWKVLYNNNGLITLISAESIGDLTLGGDTYIYDVADEYDSSLDASKIAYVKSIYTLNKLCNEWGKGALADGGRCVGYGGDYPGPDNLFDEGITLDDITDEKLREKIAGGTLNSPYRPYKSTLLSTEKSLIRDTQDTSGKYILRQTIESVWVAARDVYVSSNTSYFSVCLYSNTGAGGASVGMYLRDLDSGFSYGNADSYGVRPVITLKTGLNLVKTEGRDGTSVSKAYILGGNNLSHTIRYKSNGGEGTMADQTVTVGGSINLRKNTFTKEGYEFIGWSESAGSEVEYSDEEAITPESSMTLYAIWAPLPNEPVLGTGMKAVNWNGSAWTILNDTSSWDYNYKTATAGTTTIAGDGTAKWANAVIDGDGDGTYESHYVWIPRFTYKVTAGNGISWNSDATGTKTAKTEILFSDGTNDNTSNGTYSKHSAFTLIDKEGNIAKELPGFWIAKFEASQGDNKKPLSKAGVASWAGTLLGVNDMFNYGKKLNNNIGSHMLKNSEWGAVAYLTSAIGRIPYINDSKYTGNAGSSQDDESTVSAVTNKYDSVAGVKASTTHNVYGVYDMSGGVHEYVAMYYSQSQSNLIQNLILSNSINGQMYVDYYDTDSPVSDDATLQWDDDSSGNVTIASPVFLRGASYSDDSTAGIFSNGIAGGGYQNNFGFRVALWGENVIEKPKVNEPVVGTGMKRVNWDGENWVEATADNWDYTYNTASAWVYGDIAGDGTARWANAVIDADNDGTYESYYVWIPRFTYKVTTGNKVSWNSDADTGTEKTAKTNIIFSNGTNDITLDGEYSKHSAFTLKDKNGNVVKELTGFWIGKFETSRNTAQIYDEDIINTKYDDDDGGTIPVSKPNVVCWYKDTVSDMFNYAKALNSNLGSHMLKDSEWGAVAYLTSATGRLPYSNNSTSFCTGNSGLGVVSSGVSGIKYAYDSNYGVRASTTHNVYGVYDMCGGAYEYTSAYHYQGNNSYITNLKSSYSSDGTIYVDYYTAENLSTGDSARLGWDNNYSLVVQAGVPIPMRGGFYDMAQGIFSSHYGNGNISDSMQAEHSFRMALWGLKL